MSRLRDEWAQYVGYLCGDEHVEAAITEAEAEITRLRQLADYGREVAAAEIEGRKKAEAEVERLMAEDDLRRHVQKENRRHVDMIRDLNAEIARLTRHVEDLQEKVDPDKSCACAYDTPDDVCLPHSPIVERLTRERDEARAKLREIGNLFGAKPASLGEKALRLVLQRIRDEAGAILKGDSHD